MGVKTKNPCVIFQSDFSEKAFWSSQSKFKLVLHVSVLTVWECNSVLMSVALTETCGGEMKKRAPPW